jgi:hypothetical protein
MMKIARTVVLFYIAFTILHSVVPGAQDAPYLDLYSLAQQLWR